MVYGEIKPYLSQIIEVLLPEYLSNDLNTEDAKGQEIRVCLIKSHPI